MDELESMVQVFKKENTKGVHNAVLEKLEDLELEDHDDFVYVKRIKNDKKKAKSIFFNKPSYVIIDQIELSEGGIFSSKSLSFTIIVAAENLKVVRLDSDFKQLQSTIQIEYPHIPLPPLITL